MHSAHNQASPPRYYPRKADRIITAEEIAATRCCQTCSPNSPGMIPWLPGQSPKNPPAGTAYYRKDSPSRLRYFACPVCNPGAVIPADFLLAGIVAPAKDPTP